jgi:hypothetical protein
MQIKGGGILRMATGSLQGLIANFSDEEGKEISSRKPEARR